MNQLTHHSRTQADALQIQKQKRYLSQSQGCCWPDCEEAALSQQEICALVSQVRLWR